MARTVAWPLSSRVMTAGATGAAGALPACCWAPSVPPIIASTIAPRMLEGVMLACPGGVERAEYRAAHATSPDASGTVWQTDFTAVLLSRTKSEIKRDKSPTIPAGQPTGHRRPVARAC